MCYMVDFLFGGHDKRIVSKVLKAPREFASNIKNYDEYE